MKKGLIFYNNFIFDKYQAWTLRLSYVWTSRHQVSAKFQNCSHEIGKIKARQYKSALNIGKKSQALCFQRLGCDRGALLYLYMLRGRRWVILTSSLQVHLCHYPFQAWHLINLLNQSHITIINNTPCTCQVGFGVDSGLVVVATVIIFLICGFCYVIY